MRLLLDTHVFVWLVQDDRRVPDHVKQTISDADERLVGAPSAYEIAFKSYIGKLPRGSVLLDNWERALASLLAGELSATTKQMARAGSLEWDHRDPFDRMLVAQAQLEGLILVTADRRIREFQDVRTAW